MDCLLLCVWIHYGWLLLFHGDFSVDGCLRGKALDTLPCLTVRALERPDSRSMLKPRRFISGQLGFPDGAT